MLTISSQQRLRLGSALILTSVILVVATSAWRLAQPVPKTTASVSHTSVLLPNGLPCVQTNVLIIFPTEMSVDETRRISVKVERVAPDCKRLLYLHSPFEVPLVSSGFDIQGLSTAKAGTSFPLTFAWTISPKKEGTHELLIDLSNIISHAGSDSKFTDVRVGDQKVELVDGAVLPLKIKVTGQFGVPGWIVNAGALLPGFFGFFLTYPLFVEWLKKKYRPKPKLNKRLKVPRRKSDAP